MQRRPEVVLWGAGMVAGVHAAACQALDWRVAAVASRTGARATDLAERAQSKAMTFDELLVAKLGDIAIVATPPAAHVDASIALLEAGYHVVVEAPLACTLADADRLIETEERVGVPCPLLGAPRLGADRRRSAGTRGRHRRTHPSVCPGHPTAAVVASRRRRRRSLGRRRTLRSRRPSGRADAADGGRVRRRPTGVAQRGDRRLRHPSRARHDQTALRIGTRRGDHRSVATGNNTRLGPRRHRAPAPSCAPSSTRHRRSNTTGYPVPIGAPIRVGGPSLVDDYGYAPQLKRFWTNIRTGRPVPATSRFGRQVLDVICAAHWSAGRGAIDVPLPFAGPRDRTPAELFDA